MTGYSRTTHTNDFKVSRSELDCRSGQTRHSSARLWDFVILSLFTITLGCLYVTVVTDTVVWAVVYISKTHQMNGYS